VATAFDGTRERFWIQARHPKTVAAIEATLRHVFRTAAHAQVEPAARAAA
jgi:hypothetical protein